MSVFRRLLSERGASAVEYAILTFVTAAIVIAAAFMGNRTDARLGCAGQNLSARTEVCE